LGHSPSQCKKLKEVLRGWGEREGAEWVVRQRGEMTQALYARMNNKRKKKEEA
jgi:hypothetical protein